MNWKALSLTLAGLMGVGAIVGVTTVVVKHGQSGIPLRDAVRSDAAPARRASRTREDCREIAQAKVHDRTGEVLKDSAIGALIGAGAGSAGGAIVDGGSGAGKGAAIGGILGALGGAVVGSNKNSKEAIFKRAYDDCMSSRMP
ncbi:hypothetical protein EPO15_14840 [bacterium]|nr:MAG: hypothetical protein EPO15_14840 [bacterium]